MSTVWLNDLSSANLLRKTYISGFLDISGGDMNVRSGNFFTGGTITQNTDSANVDVPSYSMFSVTDLSYMFASITQPMTTFAQDITTNGNTVVKKNLFVTNDASFGGKLALVGDASLNSRLFLGGDASMNSRLFLGGDASMNSRLFLGGDALLNSKLTVAGDVSLNSKLSVTGDASLNSKLSVTGDASLNSKLTVTGDVSLNSKLSVTGDVSLNSKLSVTGDALLNSKLVLAGDLSLNGNLRLRNNSVFYSNNLLIKSPTPNTNDNCFINITSSTDTGGSAQNIVLGVSGAVFNRQAIINTYRDGASGFVPLSLQVDSVEKIRIESTKTILTGNVGIDTSSPTVALDVSGGALVSGNVAIGKTTAAVALDVSGGALVSGNVAIGKTTATKALDVNGTLRVENTSINSTIAEFYGHGGGGNTYDIIMSAFLDNNNPPCGRIRLIDDGLFSQHFTIWSKTTGAAANSLVERFRITSDGKVGIGITNPSLALDMEGAFQLRNTSQSTVGTMSCGNGQFLSIEAYNFDNSIKRHIALAPYGGKVGIGITNPAESLHASANVRATQYRFNDVTDVYITTHVDNIGFYGTNNQLNGYIEDDIAVANIDFTGQHRAFVKNVHFDTLECFIGLIVVADNNKYFSIDNHVETGLNSIKINESIPFCSLSKKENDKRVFGVISGAEDEENRVYSSGKFVSVFKKQIGDTRIHINSLGEGAIWVSNKNGNLESGDYITSSSIPGYGMKQDSEYLCNYTVAKITMDCDFNPLYQHTQTILKDSNGNNVLDNNNELKWTDKVDSSGNFVYEYAYEIRYILPDGTIITKEQYDIKKGNNESVYIAAFVGCTYHCG